MQYTSVFGSDLIVDFVSQVFNLSRAYAPVKEVALMKFLPSFSSRCLQLTFSSSTRQTWVSDCMKIIKIQIRINQLWIHLVTNIEWKDFRADFFWAKYVHFGRAVFLLLFLYSSNQDKTRSKTWSKNGSSQMTIVWPVVNAKRRARWLTPKEQMETSLASFGRPSDHGITFHLLFESWKSPPSRTSAHHGERLSFNKWGKLEWNTERFMKVEFQTACPYTPWLRR